MCRFINRLRLSVAFLVPLVCFDFGHANYSSDVLSVECVSAGQSIGPFKASQLRVESHRIQVVGHPYSETPITFDLPNAHWPVGAQAKITCTVSPLFSQLLSTCANSNPANRKSLIAKPTPYSGTTVQLSAAHYKTVGFSFDEKFELVSNLDDQSTVVQVHNPSRTGYRPLAVTLSSDQICIIVKPDSDSGVN